MDAEWFKRLLEVVSADGRDLAEISRKAALGRNYVQQMVKYKKVPRVDSLVALLDALGSADALYIVTGRKFTPEDQKLLEVAAQLDDEGKRALTAAFVALRGSQP
jgi:hypothetical protein